MIKAGSLIKDYFNRKNLQGEKECLSYTGIWKRVTGKNIVRSTRPVSLKEGVLFVEVEDSIWLYELTLLKDQIIRDFNRISEDMLISDIVFRSTGHTLSNQKEKQEVYQYQQSQQKKDLKTQTKKFKQDNWETEQKALLMKMVQRVPEPFQQNMSHLLGSFFSFQAWKKERGAMFCSRCRSLFFLEDSCGLGKKFCPCCTQESKDFS